ncbi:ABC transporter permease [Sphingomicrobium arenosum]|uniref:ABC transporter permease n=1 Tax=Sphingomicrobium arenosum TaxID=2233861 RepID=UPI002241011E|nr:ABC transporter permease [Sphingomicrobium arenosum]
MIWIAIRMLTGDKQKFFGLLFGIAFSTLLITQQLTIFVNLLERGASAVYDIKSNDIWVMDKVSRTPDVVYPMPSTALERVRGVPGVKWAVPHLRAGAAIRTPEGDLEGVTVIGVDDTTLIGLPEKMIEGDRALLAAPDTVFIDDVGATRLFPEGHDFIGERLELNDRRAVIRGVTDNIPTFTSQVTLTTRYSNALGYVPGQRNRMSFILVKAAAGEDPLSVAARIEEQTGLRARTRDQFARDGIDFIIENTGIPLNFGITVGLGFIVGVAIVGLTFSLFIRDNIKQFGALKAIGVHNGKIRAMVAAQAGMVGVIGYGLGLLGAALFIQAFSGNPTFKGFYTPWQIPVISLVSVSFIIMITGWVALRGVLKTEPAAVFR